MDRPPHHETARGIAVYAMPDFMCQQCYSLLWAKNLEKRQTYCEHVFAPPARTAKGSVEAIVQDYNIDLFCSKRLSYLVGQSIQSGEVLTVRDVLGGQFREPWAHEPYQTQEDSREQ